VNISFSGSLVCGGRLGVAQNGWLTVAPPGLTVAQTFWPTPARPPHNDEPEKLMFLLLLTSSDNEYYVPVRRA
jgi:hypothetical protein